jgi:hypothetical protein
MYASGISQTHRHKVVAAKFEDWAFKHGLQSCDPRLASADDDMIARIAKVVEWLTSPTN